MERKVEMAQHSRPEQMLLEQFTPEEREFIKRHNTPRKIQAFLNTLPYNWEETCETMRPFRSAIKAGTAHCFEGAAIATTVLYLNGYPPLWLCIQSVDYDHNMFVYWRNGRVGSVSQSRHPELRGKPPVFNTYDELCLSYWDDYYNEYTGDKNDKTMRGYAVIDFRIFGDYWVTATEDLLDIEAYLYMVPYKGLVEENRGQFYFAPREEGN